MKKAILFTSLFALFCIQGFAQIEVMTAEQAKEQYSSSLEVNSMDKDKSVQEKLCVVTDEMLENGVACEYTGFYPNVTGLRVFYKQSERDKENFVCVDPTSRAVSLQSMPDGFYTIVGELRFKQQVERYIEYVKSLTMTSATRIASDFSKTNPVADSLLIKKELSSSLDDAVDRDKFLLDNSVIWRSRKSLILEDKNGKNFYVRKATVKPLLACSYIEKLDRCLKGQDCVIDVKKEFMVDGISGKTVAAPDKNKTYRCEKILLIEGKPIGLFSDGTDSFALRLGKVRTWLFDEYGSTEYANFAGRSYSIDGDGICRYFDGHTMNRIINGKYAAECDAEIVYEYDNIHIIPVAFTKEKDAIRKKVVSSYWEWLKAREEAEAARLKAEHNANIQRYGSTFGANINNHKVALNMTKEMCQKSWGYPSERYSVVNRLGEVEVWGYLNALLYFSGNKLVQIEKW